MAGKKSTSTSIVVELGDPSPKKHVTRYDADEPDAALSSVYVNKAALAKIGNPDSIRVTIEAA